jgi:N-acetylglucosaminyl-diphospho-decaprenol L-rhamnosyltransferase
MSRPLISLSVVSHRQADLIHALLRDVSEHVAPPLEILVTVNVPESLPFAAADFRHPTAIVENRAPLGFGANHNAAFRRATGRYFCIVNPDIRLRGDPLPALVASLENPAVGAAGPLVRTAAGDVEASFRRFPTPLFILRKALLGAPRDADYAVGAAPISPDWIGGMFMAFRRETYAEVGGFDERYFLYYEDVDICARLRQRGYDVQVNPAAEVTHAARRDSHRRARYLGWHLRSMLRFWMSTAYRARR